MFVAAVCKGMPTIKGSHKAKLINVAVRVVDTYMFIKIGQAPLRKNVKKSADAIHLIAFNFEHLV